MTHSRELTPSSGRDVSPVPQNANTREVDKKKSPGAKPGNGPEWCVSQDVQLV